MLYLNLAKVISPTHSSTDLIIYLEDKEKEDQHQHHCHLSSSSSLIKEKEKNVVDDYQIYILGVAMFQRHR